MGGWKDKLVSGCVEDWIDRLVDGKVVGEWVDEQMDRSYYGWIANKAVKVGISSEQLF